MKKRFVLFVLLLVSFIVPVYAKNDVTLEKIAEDIKNGYSHEETTIDVTYTDSSLTISNTENEKQYSTVFSYSNGVLTYNSTAKRDGSETDIIMNDAGRISELIYSVALLNGYDKATIERHDVEELKKLNFKDNGIEVKTFIYKTNVDGNELTVQAYSSLKLDINNFKFKEENKDVVENPKTGFSYHIIILFLLVGFAIYGITYLDKVDVFRNL